VSKSTMKELVNTLVIVLWEILIAESGNHKCLKEINL